MTAPTPSGPIGPASTPAQTLGPAGSVPTPAQTLGPGGSVPTPSLAGGLVPTPSQTVGPFFRSGLAWWQGSRLVEAGFPGAVVLAGRLLDGAGEPVPDAVLEIQQAAPAGPTPPAWRGFGRSFTDSDGGYQFRTVKPRRLDDRQAPHLEISVFARGLMQRCWTRCYFPDEEAANAGDPVLSAILELDRVPTLVAARDGDGLRFDIRLQGAGETVFFGW